MFKKYYTLNTVSIKIQHKIYEQTTFLKSFKNNMYTMILLFAVNHPIHNDHYP